MADSIEKLRLERALLPDGWAENVVVTLRDGRFFDVATDVDPDGAETLRGIALPGMANLHSHAFQRGMAGLAERRSAHRDSFWTWRETMYAFLARLTPEDVEAIAAQAYVEMLEAGFTAVGEFHYLHHSPDGAPYDNPAEMAERIVAAVAATGIGLTLLPVYYVQSDFGAAPPGSGQRRFVSDLDRFVPLVEQSDRALRRLPNATLGIAPHSLRAVTPEALTALLRKYSHGPIHIHAAEQVKEVEDCVAWSGQRPVKWLLKHAGVDARWTLVHATHMNKDEVAGLAASGAVAGLCPLTESNLGDGIFEGVDYLAAGGRFGIGTDSNIRISVAHELSTLEYSQRLRDRERNRLADRAGSTGLQIFAAALAGGARALRRDMGAIEPGKCADLVILEPDHPALVAASGDAVLDAWIFAGDNACVREVWVDGRPLVRSGRHANRDVIAARFAKAMRRILT